MLRLMTRRTTVIFVIFALSVVGCQQKETAKERERQKALDVRVDAGPVNVKVEGSKQPDAKGRNLDVDVEHKH